MAIYERDPGGNFRLLYIREFRHLSFDFDGVCTKFMFNPDNESELFFFSYQKVIAFNYEQDKESIRTVYELTNPLEEVNGMINFGVFSKDLTKFIVTQED